MCIPQPQTLDFDAIAKVIQNHLPDKVTISGIASKFNATHWFWSVSYSADNVVIDNINLAKSMFQRYTPPGLRFHSVIGLMIKPGGVVQGRWQVEYSVDGGISGDCPGCVGCR